MFSSNSAGIRPVTLKTIGAGIFVTAILAFILAAISNRFQGFQGWEAFLIVALIGGALMLAGWKIIKKDISFDTPVWLGWFLLAAALLRLAAGAFWYMVLPVSGYGSPVEQGGYIMADAHARDQAAWELAGSGGPLLEAFRGYRNVDQYGGLLYLSALVYRYAGGNSHMPLLIIVLTASISALSVLFTWAFVQRTLGEKVAELAAWILLFYPDAIIQGSSQMREGFLMAMVPVACYGLARFRQDRSWSGLGFIFCGLVLTLPFSPPVSGILLVTLAILAVSLEGWQILRQVRFWIVLGGIALVAGIGIWVAWGRIAPEGISNPLALISWWITQTARWQQLFIRRTTDVVRGLFRMTPDWSHTPILVAYGVLQPFLPAAITDGGVPIWKGIAIWRSIGWNAMLTFLLAAPFISWTRDSRRRLIIGLVLAVWGVILLASLRSGGDQWDNPRYRVIFISLQATIAAWAWFEGRENKQPWLSWALTSLVIALAWVIPWDLHRDGIITWPVTDIFTTMWLALASVILYLSWNLIRKRIRKGRNDGEKTEL